MSKKNRIQEAFNYLKYKGLTTSQKDLSEKMGANRVSVSRALNGDESYLTDDFIERLNTTFNSIFSSSWLLTGEGSMLRGNALDTRADEPTEFRLRLPVTAEAGTLIGISEGITPADCERVPRIFALPDYDNTILISGNSMSPKYESGDEVAIKRAKNIMWGYVYVLDTTDGIVIKRIYDNGKSIRCNSYNPEYPDFEIPKEDVYGAFRVIGIIRRGEM